MLKASFEPLDFSQRSVVAARRTEPRYLFEWHFHPEYEVSLIESGGGTCFIGHYVGEYRAGDVFLLGPDLPHTFVSGIGTPTTAHAAAYAQFSDRTLGDALLGLPEMADVSRLLTLASRGLQMRAGEEVTWLMGSLPGGRPVDRLVTLLRVLVELTRSNPS